LAGDANGGGVAGILSPSRGGPADAGTDAQKRVRA